MPSCFVPGCKSGYEKSETVRRFFKPPNDKDTFLKWQKAIPRKDRVLSIKSYVCNNHFSDEMIIKSDKFVINDQEVELPRQNWRLKPKSVPHIFPNLPKYLTTQVKERKPVKRKVENLNEASRKRPKHVNIPSAERSSSQVADSATNLNYNRYPTPPK